MSTATRKAAAARDWRAEGRRLVERFEARAPRERAMLIAAFCGLAFLLADALWLTPALKRYNAARAAAIAAQGGIAQLQIEQQRLQASGLAQEARQKQELAQWRERVREGDAALREQAAGLVGPERMRELLTQLLARNAQVRVRAMQSLGKTELSAEGPGAMPPAAGASAVAGATAGATAGAPALRGPALYRHGIELTLEGRYADLAAYVQALEALPQRLQWGGMQLKVDQHPKAVLTLRLYTLSLERHWLEI